MSENAETRRRLTPTETARLDCATNREYTKAVFLLAFIGGGALVVIGKWQILLAGAIGGCACLVAAEIWNYWKDNDRIAKMDANLPKITFDQEV